MLCSDNGKTYIKNFEGLRLNRYNDIGGVATIGWGHTGKNLPETITLQQAQYLFSLDIGTTEYWVDKLINVPLTQNQYDALVDFTFNLGPGILKASTLRAKLNRKEYQEVPNQIRRWVYDKGIKVSALIKRREFEAKLFMA